jgi:FAD/FMN-containing dehydrogenase
MNVSSLRSSCAGQVTLRGEERFFEVLHSNLWNRLLPERSPEIIVQVAGEQDVVASIQFARKNHLKVVVRGGGHNWCQPTLRHGGLLLDLSALNQVISIDAENRRAVLQPIISNRDAQRVLNAHGLSYPTGHCPQVKLSGYLLGGGMAWNQGVWGTGAESVDAIELVTAQGELITASRDQNPDYFWAARGAGYGFFGVVTKYHLRLHPLPRAIHGSAYYFPLEDAAAVGDWLGEIAHRIAPGVELTLFLLEAPADLQSTGVAADGIVCLVTATAFADTETEAQRWLRVLENGPVKSLHRVFAKPMNFEQLFDASGALWPEGLRNHVEATFSDASPGDLVRAVSDHLPQAPSPLSLVLFAISTGPDVPARHSGMAYSMASRVYGGTWTMWEDPDEDAENIKWHRTCTSLLRPFNVGYYIGETNTVERPASAEQAFSPENWQRLADLRQQYDPEGVFFGYFDGLANE